MSASVQDVRVGVRSLIRNPSFAAVAILTLTLGIGANTAIFTLVNAVVLHPLPYPKADRLVEIHGGSAALNSDEVKEIRKQSITLESVGAYTRGAGFGITSDAGDTTRVASAEVSRELWSVLGVRPIIGQTFSDRTITDTSESVVISYPLWRQYLGADRRIIGRSVNLDNQPHTVVAVMPEGFSFPDQSVGIWTPMPASRSTSAGELMTATIAIGRLKPGVDLQTAQAELNVIARRLQRASPDSEGLELQISSLQEDTAGPVKKGFLILLGAVALILLLACLNVANLLLARNTRRRREMAVRVTLGASRPRLIRQLLAESLVIAFVGGSLGLALAPMAIHVLRVIAPPKLPRFDNASINGWVLAFTAGVSLLAGILVGIIPAFRASRTELVSSLKEDGLGSLGTRHLRLQRVLTAYQVALATVLLIGAGLVVRSFSRLMSVRLGFEPRHLLVVDLSEMALVPLGQEAWLPFYRRVLDEVHHIPGVEFAGLGDIPPVGGGWKRTPIGIEGSASALSRPESIQVQDVSPEYFRAMGIRIQSGRVFTDQDTTDLVIVNAAAAKRFWPGASPIGRRLLMGMGRGWCRVIGVADNARDISLEEEPFPQLYCLFRAGSLESDLLVRTTGKPEDLRRAVLERIWSIDKDERVLFATSMEQVISKSVIGRRFHVALLGLFALLALLMAAVGVYGMVSYSVSERTREMGIRIALGARRRDILVLVVGQQLAMAAVGLILGLLAALALAHTISSLLYGVGETDPATFIGAPVVLGLAAAVAAYIPARRAFRVDPTEAIRSE